MNPAAFAQEILSEQITPPVNRWSELDESAHLVQFYETEEFLMESLFEYVDTALRSGDACVIVAKQEHLTELESRLTRVQHDLMAAAERGCYTASEASQVLSQISLNGEPNKDLFRNIIGSILDSAAKHGKRVRVYGEMVALLWEQKQFDSAIRLEEFWNDQARTHRFALCCGYPIDEVDAGVLKPLAEVCLNHTVVVPAESYTQASTPEDRLAVIAALQHKAKKLEREILERRHKEIELRASEARYKQLKEQLELQIEEGKRLFQREQLARMEAQSANKMKDEFLATVSHELRTPLTSLYGWTRLLRSAALDGNSTSRALEAIERSVQMQRQLVEDLLDVSRISAGKLTLNIAPVQIGNTIDSVLDEARPFADRKNISMGLYYDSRLPSIQGDAARLSQVLWNLVSNAIKFTPNGGTVSVRVTCRANEIRISVEDTGEGISGTFLPHVFDRFRQADSTTTRRHGGLGLGLSIVRHLVELHGGKVQAESAGEGNGSTFIVTLPVDPAAL